MRSLTVLMPMAGRGSRFSKVGVSTPKPMISANGMPFFLRAFKSLSNIHTEKFVIACVLTEHITNHHIDAALATSLPGIKIRGLAEVTRGALETCLYAADLFAENSALIIVDCDLEFQSEKFDKLISANLNGENSYSAGILTFHSNEDRFSYAKTSNGEVSETAEKKVISNNAIVGAYFFSDAKEFVNYASIRARNFSNEHEPELYIAPILNDFIKVGKRVFCAEAEYYSSFGTPEELAAFEHPLNASQS